MPGTNSFPDTIDGSLLGISSTAIGSVGALLNFAVAIGVSRVTAAPPKEIQELVESIRIPIGAGAAAADH